MAFLKKFFPFLLFALVLSAIQVIATCTETEYYLTQLTMAAWYSLPVLGLCLVMGYAGQISLGHAAFFAVGGYAAGVVTTTSLIPVQTNSLVSLLGKAGLLVSRTNLYGLPLLHLTPWIGLLFAIGTSLLLSILIGVPALKLKGHYLAMATMGFGIIIYRILLGTSFFGAADGLSDIPAFRILPVLSVSSDFSARVTNYYLAFACVLILLILFSNLLHSRMGRALKAIHNNEEAASASGINTARDKLIVFVISALCATLGGFFLTHYTGSIGPSEASIMKSVRYVAIVAAGGMASLWGTLILGLILNFLSLRGVFGSYDDAVFGAILVMIMLFAPEGLFNIGKLKSLFRKTHGPA
ncbi:MAG: branched-chain amino acid ABC transporter permease [Elusimicrobia bacterium RIFOXYB2_FULL_49_7]|nr:MAG: branched-chain amino acid ABC transporter permease [Elusimicrobia bacterium RIFOXYB2_FULL_49_7]